MDELTKVLLQSSLVFLWGGCLFGFLIGAGMILRPGYLVNLNQICSHWVSTEKISEQIDQPRWTERLFYRHHKLVGVSVIVGSTMVLYTFLFSANLRNISQYIPRDYWWLSDALIGMLLAGNMPAAIVGIIVLLKPSLLRDLEKSTNRWISTEQLLTLFNGMHFSAEQSLLRHNRITGAAIMLGSLYTILALGNILFWRAGGL